MVLLGDLLRPQVLLDRQRVVRAALDRRVVGDDHARAALHDANARDDPGRRDDAVVEVPGGQRAELEEGAIGIDEAVDALTGQQFAATEVLGTRGLRASAGDDSAALCEQRDQLRHVRGASGERLTGSVDVSGENRHLRSREVYGVRPIGRSPVGNG